MSIELLINGEIAFERILKRIEEAKESISINMYIWRDDRIGNKLADELLAAADRGVKVLIIKDEAGSVFEKSEENKTSFFHKKFNSKVALAQYVFSKSYFRYIKEFSNSKSENLILKRMLSHKNIEVRTSFRNDHSKFYIIDKKILILGGINVEDKELYSDLKNRKYSDYMVEIEGEHIAQSFIKKLDNNDYQINDYSNVDFYFNLNTKGIFQVKPMILKLMEEAKSSIDIEMAYFGDKDITRKIIECVNSGIKVSIITSLEANVQNDLNFHILNKIYKETENKVNILLSSRMIHSKFMCVDNEKFFFGSANFNKRGMVDLSELNVYIKDDGEILTKWQKWRSEHIDECINFSENLKYNKFIAFIEGLIC